MSLRQALESRLAARVLARRTFHTHQGLHLFSSARGGSTWLMSMLSQLPGVVPMWEPLHTSKGVGRANWGDRPHGSAMGAEDQEHLNALMSGRMHNAWTASRASAGQALHGRQLLFKYVRANGLLPWFLQQPLQHKPLLLMRHPLDIVTSQVRAFGPRPMEVDPAVAFPGHVALHRAWPELKRIHDDVERQLHIWALTDGRIWEQHAGSDAVVPVHYCDLALQPRESLRQVLDAWGWRSPASGWDAEAFLQRVDPNMTSDTDFQGDRLKDQQAQLAKNVTRLSPTRRAQLQSVLDMHGIGLYHMGDVSPAPSTPGRKASSA